ncbi:amidohydrolase family protein [bacterium]|nr:amidohydrolase family protein [bacterium]
MAKYRGPLIDYHAHLKGEGEIDMSGIPQYPILHKLADALEPLLYRGVNLFARHGRSPRFHRLYREFTYLGFHELLRLLNKYRVDKFIESMDRNGIERAVVCVIEPFIGTIEVLDAIAPHRDRISVYCAVDPYEPRFLERLAFYVETGQVVGLKIHPPVAGPHPASTELMEMGAFAQAHALPVFIHAGTFPFPMHPHHDDVEALEPFIARYDGIPIVLGHIGWDQHEKVLRLGEKYPHIHVETSWQPPAIIREAIDRLGKHRVLMGSDFPLLSQEVALRNVLEAVTPEEGEWICHRNAERMIAHHAMHHPVHLTLPDPFLTEIEPFRDSGGVR